MGLFGPPNIEKLKTRRDVNGLVKALSYKKFSQVRQEAAKALGESGDAGAVEPLIKALQDQEAEVRGAAAEALGRISDARAVEPLIATLKDKNSGVLVAVAVALGKIGDKRAVKPLIIALQDNNNSARLVAAAALGKIRDTEAVGPLIVQLKDNDSDVRQTVADALVEIGLPAVEQLSAVLKDKDPKVRETVTILLEQIGWQPGKDELGAIYWVTKARWDKCVTIGEPAIGPLVAALRDKREIVRRCAVESLEKIGDEQALKALVGMLRDKNADVRQATTRALDKFGWQPDNTENGAIYWTTKREWGQCIELGQIAIPPLTIALNDNDRDVRRCAAGALGQIAARPGKRNAAFYDSARSLLEHRLLHDDEWGVRQAAARALGQIGDVLAVESLLEAAAKDENQSVCQEARSAAVNLGQLAIAPLIAAFADENVRGAAIDMLVDIGTPAIEPLIAIIKIYIEAKHWVGGSRLELEYVAKEKRKNGTKALAAAEALVKIGAEAISPLFAVFKGIADDSTSMLMFELLSSSLKKIKDPQAVGLLVGALQEKNSLVRRAAAEALGNLGDRQAVDPLIAILKDSDRMARRAAAKALGQLGDLQAVVPLINASKDSDKDVRQEVIYALGEIGDVHALDALQALLYPRVGYMDFEVAKALGKLGDMRTIENLIAKLEDANMSTRQASARALVDLYRSNRIDERLKQAILSQHDKIIIKHLDVRYDHEDEYYDEISHNDGGYNMEHDDQDIRIPMYKNSPAHHSDNKGIGIDFPL